MRSLLWIYISWYNKYVQVSKKIFLISRYKYVHVWKYICQSAPIYVQGTQIVPLHCEKVRISSPRCDNNEVHYIPGIPVNSKFILSVGKTLFLCVQTCKSKGSHPIQNWYFLHSIYYGYWHPLLCIHSWYHLLMYLICQLFIWPEVWVLMTNKAHGKYLCAHLHGENAWKKDRWYFENKIVRPGFWKGKLYVSALK